MRLRTNERSYIDDTLGAACWQHKISPPTKRLDVCVRACVCCSRCLRVELRGGFSSCIEEDAVDMMAIRCQDATE